MSSSEDYGHDHAGSDEASDPHTRERHRLLAAHANRALTAHERDRLLDLVASDARAAAEVAAVRELHALFDQERELLHLAVLPSEPWEEGDPLWQRLAPHAARAEQRLRHRLLTAGSPGRGPGPGHDGDAAESTVGTMAEPDPGGCTPSERTSSERTPRERTPDERTPGERTRGERTRGERTQRERTPGERTADERKPRERTAGERTSSERTPAARGSTGRRLATLALAIAAVVIAAFWLGRGSRPVDVPPELTPARPDGSTLGTRGGAGGAGGTGGAGDVGSLGNFVIMAPRLAADARTLSWQPVIGARAYDVSVLDAAGKVLLRRDDAEASSTEWTITIEQFQTIERQAAPLSVRVVARDGAGIAIGSSGDQPLSVVRSSGR